MAQHAVQRIGGYDRTPECLYVHPDRPSEQFVSKAKAYTVNPDANLKLLDLMAVKGIGPAPKKVNARLVLYKVEDLRRADLKALVERSGDDRLKDALRTGNPSNGTMQRSADDEQQSPGEKSAVAAVRTLNELIRAGNAKVVQKPDGTLRVLMTVELG